MHIKSTHPYAQLFIGGDFNCPGMNWLDGFIRMYITEHIDSQIRLFADDCLMYRIIDSREDHTILQKDLTLLTNWAKNGKSNLIYINVPL